MPAVERFLTRQGKTVRGAATLTSRQLPLRAGRCPHRLLTRIRMSHTETATAHRRIHRPPHLVPSASDRSQPSAHRTRRGFGEQSGDVDRPHHPRKDADHHTTGRRPTALPEARIRTRRRRTPHHGEIPAYAGMTEQQTEPDQQQPRITKGRRGSSTRRRSHQKAPSYPPTSTTHVESPSTPGTANSSTSARTFNRRSSSFAATTSSTAELPLSASRRPPRLTRGMHQPSRRGVGPPRGRSRCRTGHGVPPRVPAPPRHVRRDRVRPPQGPGSSPGVAEVRARSS